MNQSNEKATFVAESVALITRLCAEPWTTESHRIIEEAAGGIVDSKNLSVSSLLSGEPTSVFWESPDTDETGVWEVFDGIIAGIAPTVGNDYNTENAWGGAKVAQWNARPHANVLIFAQTPLEVPPFAHGSVNVALSRASRSVVGEPVDAGVFLDDSLALITSLTAEPWTDATHLILTDAVGGGIDTEVLEIASRISGEILEINWSATVPDDAERLELFNALVGAITAELGDAETETDAAAVGATAQWSNNPHAFVSLHAFLDRREAVPIPTLVHFAVSRKDG